MSSAYSSAVLFDKPLRYYRLDESSGTVAHDLGSQAQSGTINNSPALSQTGLIIGDVDPCMLFHSGTFDYISLPTTGLPTGAQPWSVDILVNFAALVGAGLFPTLLGFGNGTNTHDVVFYFDGNVQAFVASFPGLTNIVSSIPVTAGHTYYLALTFDGTTAILYAYDLTNGTSSSDSHAEAFSLAYGAFNIGAASGVYSFISARLDEVAIYNSALSATRVLAHYNAGVAVNSNVGASIRRGSRVRGSEQPNA